MLTASSGYVKKRNKIYLRIWRTSEREPCYIYRQFHRTGPRLGLYWKLIDQINLMGFFTFASLVHTGMSGISSKAGPRGAIQ